MTSRFPTRCAPSSPRPAAARRCSPSSTRPVPQPGAGEILVKVAAAGVNRPDVLQRQGALSAAARRVRTSSASRSPARSSRRARAPRASPRATAVDGPRGRAAATREYAAVHETQRAAACPPACRMVEAGAIPRPSSPSGPTSSSAARLKPGETLLVHGGTSGIGTTAIQLAKAFGATSSRRPDQTRNARPAARLGADLAVNYRDAGFRRRGEGSDRRPRRRRHPRHGRRRLHSAQLRGRGRRGAHRPDRLPQGAARRPSTSAA